MPLAMRNHALAFTLALSTLAPLAGQSAGYRDLTFVNTTGQGSATIPSRVYYPATAAGANTPLVPRVGGYPVIVFLHGFAALGNWYAPVGEAFAQAGYVAVLHNTAQFAAGTQVLDALALYPALQAANTQTGFLQGALDMTRAGVCGHSMGGGSTLAVLARNPGYRLGIALAGVDAAAGAAGARVPLLFVHGTGDTIVSVSATDNNFAAATTYTGLKSSYVFDAAGSHTNVAGFALVSATDQAVFARVRSVMVGFCDRFLGGSDVGLEGVFGAAARAEARLARTATAVQAAELWRDRAPTLGATLALGIAGEPGAAALLIAAGPGQVLTPFGELLLDPASVVVLATPVVSSVRLVALPLLVPNDAGLIGADIPLQIAAPVRDQALRLGRSLTLRITP
jgi:pimeloyl-ACP methyl ester carboxylesterase